MTIVLATHNKKKRAELARILAPLGHDLADVPLSDVEETGLTFEENARLKAASGCRETGLPCVGDDSGLCVDALDGAPGVFSARFVGTHGDDEANIAKLLDMLRDTPEERRTARFVCSICCVYPDGREIALRGTCEGRIAFGRVGTGGFGYDPVFLPDEAPGFTMAQLSPETKDKLSHRGKALALLAEKLMQGDTGVKVIVLPDKGAIGQAVGDLICDLVSQKQDAVLGLATGSSPVPTYQRMAARHRAGEASFQNVKTFNLDEYCDLPEEHETSYHTFMREQLFSHIDILPGNTHFLDGNCADEAAESERFSRAIGAAGGIDLQLLGIGRNGHIGFNEPGPSFTGAAYRTALTESTIEANSPNFVGSDIPMPHYAMTMGVGQILQARQIVLIATGEEKAKAVKAMLEGEITPRCPASILQEHPDVTVYLDPAAAALLADTPRTSL